MNIEQAAAEEFDGWAARGKGSSMADNHRPIVEPVVSRWTLGPRSHVLDVGCGSGWAVRWMLGRGAGRATGVDISPEMVRLARGGPGDFHVASGERLPLQDASVSHLLSVESLYYYADPSAALREWARVAAEGAQLACVIELFSENPCASVWAEMLDIQVHDWSEQRWLAEARAAGWDASIERVVRSGPMKSEEDFQADRWTPSYAAYVGYWQAGALAITGSRR